MCWLCDPPPPPHTHTQNNATVDTPSINNNSHFLFCWTILTLTSGGCGDFFVVARVYGPRPVPYSPLVTLRHIAPITSYPLIHQQKYTVRHSLCFGGESKERLSLSHQRSGLNTQHYFITKGIHFMVQMDIS
jgi:hypothetical protein